ncbi:unnamed protein product [Amoebophrya sp. A25]|nr:unnamed protein product [Amoebophrya sp. A25]|eukprot:GSA25T00017514001.1
MTMMAEEGEEQSEAGREDIFTLLLEPGDEAELLLFLTASQQWFSSLSVPPSRNDFKTFLEGGYAELHHSLPALPPAYTSTGRADSGSGSPPSGKATSQQRGAASPSSRDAVLQLLESQRRYLEKNVLGTSTSSASAAQEHDDESWRNTTLEAFLDAATDVSGFRSGHYEPNWGFLLDFFQEGQQAE